MKFSETENRTKVSIHADYSLPEFTDNRTIRPFLNRAIRPVFRYLLQRDVKKTPVLMEEWLKSEREDVSTDH